MKFPLLKFAVLGMVCLKVQLLVAQIPHDNPANVNHSYQYFELFKKLDIPLWSTSGNSGIRPGINFLGTTDNQPLIFRTKNTERIRIQPQGNIGVGIFNPHASAIMDIYSVTKGVLFPA